MRASLAADAQREFARTQAFGPDPAEEAEAQQGVDEFQIAHERLSVAVAPCLRRAQPALALRWRRASVLRRSRAPALFVFVRRAARAIVLFAGPHKLPVWPIVGREQIFWFPAPLPPFPSVPLRASEVAGADGARRRRAVCFSALRRCGRRRDAERRAR